VVVILHASDIHCSYGVLERLLKSESFDIIAVSGDFECRVAVELLERYSDIAVAVAGNMDDYSVEAALTEAGINVNGVVKVVGGLRFVGVSGRGVARNAERTFQVLRDSGGGVDVLVTHYPPHGTKVDKAVGFVHAGSRHIRRLIEEFRPRLVLCGHIHESPGTDRIGETLVVNAGSLGIRGIYAVIDTETMRVEHRTIKP